MPTRPPLFPHQERAIQWLHERDRAALFIDMGGGKTRATLEALTADRLPALVVAPKRVAELVWPEEASRWRPDLRVALAAGQPRKRQAALQQGADITIISRDNLADAVGGPWRTIVLDELSGFKSRASKRWRAAKKLTTAPGVRCVWGLTGTPTPNGLMDLWAQVYLIDGGQRLGTTLGGYRSRYFTPGRQLPSGVVTEWLLRPGAAARIHSLLEDLALSMTAEDMALSLPPLHDNEITVPFLPNIKAIYRQMKDTLVADIDLLEGAPVTAGNAAILSSKLSQISAGLLFPDDASTTGAPPTILHHEKVRAVQEIVEGTGSPVLVFYHFKAERDMLLQELPGARTTDIPDLQRRWNAGEIPVLLAHPQSAGHGLNLQHGGHTIVWTTHPWSLEEYQQANKRVLRPGQKNPVTIHHLITPGAVDRAILRRLEGKASVQEALLDHLRSPRG